MELPGEKTESSLTLAKAGRQTLCLWTLWLPPLQLSERVGLRCVGLPLQQSLSRPDVIFPSKMNAHLNTHSKHDSVAS